MDRAGVVLERTIPCLPKVERGYPASLHAHGNRLIYGAGTSVVITSVADLNQATLYREHLNPVTSAAFAHHGNLVASGDSHGQLRIWASDHPEQVLRLELQLLNGVISDIKWTFDSQRMCAVGAKGSFGKVFMTDSGNSVGEISGHHKSLLSCDFKPNRPMKLVTVGEDFQTSFFEGPPFRLKKFEKVHGSYVNSVRYSPDGSKYATVGSDRKVFIYDGLTGDIIEELKSESASHTASVLGCAWIDNERLATCGMDGRVIVWCLPNGVLNVIESKAGPLVAIQKLVSGELVVLGFNGTLGVISNWESGEERVAVQHQSAPSHLVYLDDSNLLVSTDVNGVVLIRNPESPISQISYTHDSAILGLAKNSSNTIIASIEVGKKLAIYDISTTTVEKLDLEEEPISVTFDQNSNHILVLAHNNTAIKVNAETKQTEIFRLPFECRRAAWSHGKFYITDSAHNIHSSSDLTTFELLPKLHINEISDLKVSPNGEYLATADSNRVIYIWKTEDYSILRDRWTYHTSRITELGWSKDSKYLITGSVDYNMILWAVDSDAPVEVVKQAHKLGVNSVCFGRIEEGKLQVFSSGNDFSIKKWVINL